MESRKSPSVTRQWKVNARKQGAKYMLYVATSDEAIRIDQQAGTGHSLIEFARHDRFSSEHDDDHRDLAVGAFGYFAKTRNMDLGGPLVEVDSIPGNLGNDWLGGKPGSGTFAVIVYEQQSELPAKS
jgi:hypothetical protein